MTLNSQYTERARKILTEHARSLRDVPFFLYVAFAHTHTPLAYDPKFENASNRPGRTKIFGNTLAEVDSAIGQILDTLELTGLSNETLVLLTADNGPADLGSVAKLKVVSFPTSTRRLSMR